MFAKPKAGLAVFDPARRDYLPEEGREVGPAEAHGYYWHRRLQDADIDSLDEAAAKKSVADADVKRAQAAKDAEVARRAALTTEQRDAEDKAAGVKQKG